MYIVLGGLGMQGKAIVRFLELMTDEDIVIIDPIESEYPNDKGRIIHKRDNYISLEKYDFDDEQTVISCLPAQYNLKLTEMCIRSKKNLIDLGGDIEIVRKQFALEKEASFRDVSIVPDCGLAPGIISSLAAKFVETENGLCSIKVYCGGLPKFPELPLGYTKVFSPEGVIREYSGLCHEVVNGRVVSHPALSGVEKIFVPSLGVLEAARTSGGISVSTDVLQIRNFSYKTLRFPGHWDYVKEHIMPQRDPISVLNGLISPVSNVNPDIVVLLFKLEYSDGSEDIMDFYWEYDYENDISAMAQATGYTAGAVALLVHDNFVRTGVVRMDEFDSDQVIDKVNGIDGQYLDQPFSFDEEG